MHLKWTWSGPKMNPNGAPIVSPLWAFMFLQGEWTSGVWRLHDFIFGLTIYFEQLLQGNMDLRCRLITHICKLLGDCFRTMGRTLKNFYLTPLSNCKSSGARFVTWGGSNIHIAVPIGKKYEGVKIVAYIFWTSPMLTPHEKGGDITSIYLFIYKYIPYPMVVPEKG